jgi:hypothetical protein
MYISVKTTFVDRITGESLQKESIRKKAINCNRLLILHLAFSLSAALFFPGVAGADMLSNEILAKNIGKELSKVAQVTNSRQLLRCACPLGYSLEFDTLYDCISCRKLAKRPSRFFGGTETYVVHEIPLARNFKGPVLIAVGEAKCELVR